VALSLLAVVLLFILHRGIATTLAICACASLVWLRFSGA
jgi:hypothetical protein